MGKKSNQPAQDVINQAKTAQASTTQPSAQENMIGGLAGDVGGVYRNATAQNMQDYGNIMGGYNALKSNLADPNNPLNKAGATYGRFADTGGYSAQDIQEARSRATQPIQSAYANSMQQLDRARALGGGGANAPNYIAAVSKAQRQLPQQMEGALNDANSTLAQNIRTNQLAGAQGEAGVGQATGQLGQGIQSGMTGLYGSSPGMSNSFANQFGNLNTLQGQLQGQRQNYGLGLMGAQIGGYSANQGQSSSPWWQKALGATAAGAATYFSGGALAPAAGSIYSGVANA
jgi:hypothetical protein